MAEYFIGIDGGATKSWVGVAGPAGNIIHQKVSGALNYHATGERCCQKNLKEALLPLIKKYRKVKAVAIGFAGLDNPQDLKVYRKITRRILPQTIKTLILNDAEIALEDACPNDKNPRLLIICGTGSSCYGEFKGKKAKSVGWDFLLGDEGSAFWMGLRALKAAVRSWDGRGRSTVLEKLVLKKAKKKDISELIPAVYQLWHDQPGEFKKYIASFAPLFHKPGALKDPLAKEIIERAAEELALGAEAVAKRLGLKKEPLCVGFIGSGFNNSGLLLSLSAKIRKKHPQARFVYQINPVKGAIKLAIKHS